MAHTKPTDAVFSIYHETVINVNKFEYIWKIRNISHSGKQPGQALKSSIFCASNDSSAKWQLLLYPKGSQKEFSESISLHLCLQSSDRPAVNIKYTFSLLDKDSQEHFVRSVPFPVLFKPGLFNGYDEYVDWSDLIEPPDNLLPSDTLTILCRGSVATDYREPVPECTLREDLATLLDNPRFGDVWLCTGDSQKFLAHKAILSARSPVFSAMFNHNMEESNCNRVDITDLDHDVLQEVVSYMYTGKTPDLEGAEGCLLAAADKYQLPGLKTICENELATGLSIENATELLILADRHGANYLKKRTLGFIDTHLKSVIGTPGWKEITLSHPNLVREVSEESGLKYSSD